MQEDPVAYAQGLDGERADPVAYAQGFYGTGASRPNMETGYPAPIKAPGVSRGIANRQKNGDTDKLKTCRHVLQGFVQCMQPGSGA